jgi:hypothetical protein
MIPVPVQELIAAGPSLLMGTRDATLLPETTRLTGIVLGPEADALTVFVADAAADRALANLRDNGQVAITCSHPATHVTYQLKGKATGVRRAKGPEREIVDRYRAEFSCRLEEVGVSVDVSSRLSGWPAYAIRVQVLEIFEQTPGPGAGERVGGAGG